MGRVMHRFPSSAQYAAFAPLRRLLRPTKNIHHNAAPRRNPMASSDAELAQLIEPGRVHRRVYTDPAIFELEMTRIFGTAWIYVGHESQVKNPGDYFCTRIGRKPAIMVRGADGEVRVIHNQCAHRGAMVVALEHGNAPA